MDYYNFLEALWRVSMKYPYSKEVNATHPTLDSKFKWFI
jgi:hypothetical protein